MDAGGVTAVENVVDIFNGDGCCAVDAIAGADENYHGSGYVRRLINSRVLQCRPSFASPRPWRTD